MDNEPVNRAFFCIRK